MNGVQIRPEQIYNSLWTTYPEFSQLTEEQRWAAVKEVEQGIKNAQPSTMDYLLNSDLGKNLIKEGLTFTSDYVGGLLGSGASVATPNIGGQLLADTLSTGVSPLVNTGMVTANGIGAGQGLYVLNDQALADATTQMISATAPQANYLGAIMPGAQAVLGAYGAYQGANAFLDAVDAKDQQGMLLSGTLAGASAGSAVAGAAGAYAAATATEAAVSPLMATGWGAAIGLAIAALTAVGVKNFGSSKTVDERLRQWSRDYLSRTTDLVKRIEGEEGENHWVQLSDGSLYNIGQEDYRGQFQDVTKGNRGKIQPFEMTDAELKKYGSRVDIMEALLAAKTEGLEDFSKQANRQLAQQLVLAAASQGDANLDANLSYMYGSAGITDSESYRLEIEKALSRGLITPIEANKYLESAKKQIEIMGGKRAADPLIQIEETDQIDADHYNRMRKEAGEYVYQEKQAYDYIDPQTGVAYEKTADGGYQPITKEEYQQGKRLQREGQNRTFYSPEVLKENKIQWQPTGNEPEMVRQQGIDYAFQTGQIDEKTAEYLTEQNLSNYYRGKIGQSGGGGLANLNKLNANMNSIDKEIYQIQNGEKTLTQILEESDEQKKARISQYYLGLEARGQSLSPSQIGTPTPKQEAPQGQTPQSQSAPPPQTATGSPEEYIMAQYQAQAIAEQKRQRDEMSAEAKKQRQWNYFTGGQDSPNMVSQQVSNRREVTPTPRKDFSLFDGTFTF